MEYIELSPEDKAGICEMSKMATAIVREHFDPLIGKEQNDYMLEKFQTEQAIAEQLKSGYHYFLSARKIEILDFWHFIPKKMFCI